MVDYHSHILPGMDDGSKSIEESLALLSESVRQGIRVQCLTSHYYADRESPKRFLERRSRAYAELKQAMKDLDIQTMLGAEVQYFEGICNIDEIEALKLEGTEILLIEMPFSKWTARMARDIWELNSRPGIQVMLAHIERYMKWNDLSVFEQMHKNGIILQSNASFFNSWRTRRKALKLFDRGYIDIVASDCHNTTSRPQELGEALKTIASRLGRDKVDRMASLCYSLLEEGI